MFCRYIDSGVSGVRSSCAATVRNSERSLSSSFWAVTSTYTKRRPKYSPRGPCTGTLVRVTHRPDRAIWNSSNDRSSRREKISRVRCANSAVPPSPRASCPNSSS